MDQDLPVRVTTNDGADGGISVVAARLIAARAHEGQVGADGEPYIAHVGRVAAGMPPFARPAAWLHDVIERSDVDESLLIAAGANPDQCLALRLLSRDASQRSDDACMAHVRSIALSPGPAGRIARAVKRADLLDHLTHPAARSNEWAPPHRAALVLLTILASSSPAPTSGRERGRGGLSG